MARRDILNGSRVREIKDRKKKIFYAKLYLGIFVLVCLMVGFVYLSRYQKILIQKVNISGNNAIMTDQIKELVDQKLTGHYLLVFPRNDIFIFSEKGIEKLILDTYRRISNVKIKINNLREITVNVTERDGKYLWCDQQEKCFFMDSTGYIFDDAPTFSGNAYLKFYGVFQEPDEKIGQYILPSVEFARLIKFYNSLSDSLLPIRVSALSIEENGEYKLFLEGTEGKIVFKKENDFDKLVENFNSAVKSEPLVSDLAKKLGSLQYIDLRFDNKVYFKF
jgi:cell division septal protein FtsQ